MGVPRKCATIHCWRPVNRLVGVTDHAGNIDYVYMCDRCVKRADVLFLSKIVDVRVVKHAAV